MWPLVNNLTHIPNIKFFFFEIIFERCLGHVEMKEAMGQSDVMLVSGG